MTYEDVKFAPPFSELLPGKGQWTWRVYSGDTRLVIGCPACGRTVLLEARYVDKYGVYKYGRVLRCGHTSHCRAQWSLRLLGWAEHQPRN